MAVDTSQSRVDRIIARIDELRELNQDQFEDRARTRDLLDGGLAGISRLVGRDVTADAELLPVANFFIMANHRHGQKLGVMPDVKVDPPAHIDSDRAKKAADKRVRIVAAWDRAAKMPMQMPQLGRWLPGYGFVPFVVKQKKGRDGKPYPHAGIRDPFACFPAQWGVDQQPNDLAFLHRFTEDTLIDLYPHFASTIKRPQYSPYNRGPGGSVLLHAPSWESQTTSGMDVYEYINMDGTWWILPERKLLLEFVPNPIRSRPPFHVFKRFAFNKLAGQYDHAVGLMGAVARMNMLLLIATEDTVFAETNIEGDMMSGGYQKGRGAINHLAPGTRVHKMNDRVPFEAFNHLNGLMAQLRSQVSYPVMEDAISPNSFVTGAGLEELRAGVDGEVKEYQTVIRDGIEELDSLRFEFADNAYPNRTLTINGVVKGTPYSETYKPSAHINGNYLTRRIYGMMAGWDEPVKIVGGVNLLQNEVIDLETFRENLDGLENLTKIEERIRHKKIEDGMFAVLAGLAQQGDPRMIKPLVNLLPDGDMKKLLMETLVTPMEEQAEQQQQAAPPPGTQLPEGPPNTSTVLARLTNTARPVLGAQSVGTVG